MCGLLCMRDMYGRELYERGLAARRGQHPLSVDYRSSALNLLCMCDVCRRELYERVLAGDAANTTLAARLEVLLLDAAR
jgi:hypothetical protein